MRTRVCVGVSIYLRFCESENEVSKEGTGDVVEVVCASIIHSYQVYIVEFLLRRTPKLIPVQTACPCPPKQTPEHRAKSNPTQS